MVLNLGVDIFIRGFTRKLSVSVRSPLKRCEWSDLFGDNKYSNNDHY
jgi:hypothetical protein